MDLDTLALSKGLESSGFGKPQAEGLAEAIVETAIKTARNLVTKDHLEVKIAEVRGEMKDIEVKISEVRGEIKESKLETIKSKVETIKWVIGLHSIGLGLTFAFIYFLLRH